MQQFINARETLVTEALDGLLRTAGGRLARLDGYPNIKVVLRADWRADRVALVSGGGAGHEPAHAGFVGEGLLTAALLERLPDARVHAYDGSDSMLAATRARAATASSSPESSAAGRVAAAVGGV